jgi:flagellar protein FlaJ
LSKKTKHYIGYRIIGDFPTRFSFLKKTVQMGLARAQLRISHSVYLGSMFFWTLVSIPIAAGVGFPLTFAINMLLNLFSLIELLLLNIGIAFGTGGVVFAAFLFYPTYLSGNIKGGIDKDIVYIINYMAILAGAGVTTEDIYTSLSSTDGVYMVEGSAKSVVRDIELLGKDIISAIDDESKVSPSKKYSRILQGLIGTIRTGGNLKEYLKDTADHQMEVRRRELARLVSQLNLAAEAYIVLGIAFPVILTTLLSMMGMFGGEIAAGLGPTQMMMLMIYLLFPIASIGVLVLIDGLTSSW